VDFGRPADARAARNADDGALAGEVIRMDKLGSINWRRLLYTAAAMATLLMAAGAKYKN
jgi:hypothetical protein